MPELNVPCMKHERHALPALLLPRVCKFKCTIIHQGPRLATYMWTVDSRLYSTVSCLHNCFSSNKNAGFLVVYCTLITAISVGHIYNLDSGGNMQMKILGFRINLDL